MKKIIFSFLTFFAISGYAQLKVGSNPKLILSNTNFQVESTSGQQFVVSKDSSKVGVGTNTPAAKLDVIGTVKITDGSQGIGKVLVSDANGLASWKNASTLSTVSTDSTSASNGLTLSGKDVQLGGTLTKATTITTSASNTIAFSGLQSGASTDSILVVNPSTGVVKNVSPTTLGASAEPWFNVATSKGATANTQNIYQMGKVGINTNNPLEQLDVNGNINQRGYTYLRKVTGNTSAFIWTNFAAGGDRINYSFNYQNTAGNDSVYNSGYGTNSFSQGNSGFFFNTSNGVNGVAPTTNVMFINTVGLVGINTLNPSAKLHVVDTANNTPLRLEGLASGSTSDSLLVVNPSTGVVYRKSPSAIASGATTNDIIFNSSTKILTSTVNGKIDTALINFASIDSTTASNGLTLSGKDVQLGGTLTKATTITTTASNTIALAGLQSGASTDSILVVNPSTGVIKRLSPSVLGSASEPWYSTATSKGATLNTENIYQMARVGINTNNPLEQLDINGNINQRGYTYLRKLTGNTSAFIWTNFNAGGDRINYSFNYQNTAGNDSVYNSGYGTNSFSQGNSGFFFNTSNGVNGVAPTTNVMFINTVGRVGINTQNPSAKLHVVDTANNTPLRLEGLVSGNIATDSVLVATSTGVVKRVSMSSISSSGNVVGDIKTGLQSADHSGWIKLDGRLKSTLTAAQQANATALGIGTNLPNAANAYLVQNATTLGSVSGSNTRTIAQNQLPNVTLSGSTSSNGDHSHTTTVSSQLDGTDDGNYTSNVQRGDNSTTSNQTWSTNTAGAHTHTFTTSSINGGVAQQTLDIKPLSLSVNVFVYLGN